MQIRIIFLSPFYPKGVFRTVADEVDFIDSAVEGGRVDERGVMFEDGEDIGEDVVDGLFGDGDGTSSSQDLSTWRVTIPSVAETPSGKEIGEVKVGRGWKSVLSMVQINGLFYL